MTSPQTTLAPCPKCGLPPRVRSLPKIGPIVPYMVWVECPSPSCRARTASEASYGRKGGAIKRARAAWNEGLVE